MKDFGNSILGHGLAAAFILIALLGGLSLIVKSCSDAASACAEAGGSYDGNNGSCNVPDVAR